MAPFRPDEKCEEIFALLSEFLNGELPSEVCERIGRHIADCQPCAVLVESLRKTVDICRQFRPGIQPGPLGEQARNRLMEACRGMLAGRKRAD